MTGEETPKRPTVRIGRHFVREERFNSSGTTSVSIEYNLILSKFTHCFSCHEKAVTSASAVQPLHFDEQVQNHGSRILQPEPPTMTKPNQPSHISRGFEPANQSICVESIQSTEERKSPDVSEREMSRTTLVSIEYNLVLI